MTKGDAPASDLSFLRYEVESSVATVFLSRPPVNAINRQMFIEISMLFADLSRLPGPVTAIVLASSERHFCAGTDFKEFQTLTPDSAPERNRIVREAFWAIYDCEVPVIAAVNGMALGSGVAFAGSCDFVVASEDAMFGLPEVSIGVMGGAKHLSRLVPQGVVRRMFYTSERLPATELVQYGGIAKVVPGARLLDEARTLASQIARHNPMVVRMAKHALNTIEPMGLKAGYEFEQSLTAELSGRAEAKESLTAEMMKLHTSHQP